MLLSPSPATTPPVAVNPPKQLPGAGVVVTLNVLAILSFIAAIGILTFAKSAVHEIEGGIAIMCFISALSGATIIDVLRKR